MSETLNLVVNFVSASQPLTPQAGDLTSSPQTGDLSMLILFTIITLFLCGIAVLFAKKNCLSFLGGTIRGAHVKQQSTIALFRDKIIVGVIALFSAVIMISGLVTFTQAFAGDDGSLTPDTNNITATVADDGSIAFSDCNLINYSDSGYSVEMSSVDILDEAKSIDALNDSVFTIWGFNGILFNGNPDGEEYYPSGLTALPSQSSTKLSFNLQNLDKDSALALCGKSVFEITLIPAEVQMFTVDANVDDVTHGSISGSPVKNVAYGTPYIVDNTNKTITIGNGTSAQVITFNPSLGFDFDKWMDGEHEAESGVITSSTTFTALTKIAVKWVSFKNVDGHDYYPVFLNDKVPQGVTFYGADKKTVYTKKSPEIAYAKLEGGVSIHAVRSVNDVSWNDTFVENNPGSVYPYSSAVVKQSFKSAYLVGGTENIEQVFMYDGDPSTRGNNPLFDGIRLGDIWKEYTNVGFGGTNGNFWTYTAGSNNNAYIWSCSSQQSSKWVEVGRDVSDGMCVWITRTFS